MPSLYSIAKPILFRLEAEKAHNLSIRALKNGLLPRISNEFDPVLASEHFGIRFPNPVGLAAGYDKNAEVIPAISGLGFGFVEAGSITPRAQPGNPKPRLFRLAEDAAVINRLGFNNRGLDEAERNFKAYADNAIVGANLGANKDSGDRIDDYVRGMKRLAPLASYITVNISSPNTPGLRALQGKAELDNLLGRLCDARNTLKKEGVEHFPILLKIAPDLTDDDKVDIAVSVLAMEIEGLIISNTTITRPASLTDSQKAEAGGLSGRPLKHISLGVLKEMYQATGGKILIVGVGGIETAADAYERIRAGASLIQLYSAMVYHGPYVAADIARGLAELLRKDGFENITDAIGIDTPI